MSTESYKTIAQKSSGLFKDRGSKFHGFAYPIKDEEEIKTYLEELKKEFYDARHYCYAFILGADGQHFRASDDGEPAHSAGDPILGQIRSLELTHCLVVVVRYFGGTKLGVPGLINAYRTAAREALENSRIVKKFITFRMSIHFPYSRMNDVMQMTKSLDLKVINQNFELDCELVIEIKPSLEDQIRQKLSLFDDIRIDRQSS